MTPKFYGLLIAPEGAERIVNLAAGHDPLDIYLRCAASCSRSFAHFGYDWALLTDDRRRLERRCEKLGVENLPIRESRFEMHVPADLPFRSAHFKLELIEKFARGDFGEHIGLVDLDTVCLRPIPGLDLCAEAIMGYDISESETAGGAEGLIASLEILMQKEALPRWWGGEFLFGPAAQFARLAQHIKALWPRYLANRDAMIHLGDEMVMTAALQDYASAGNVLVDGGKLGVIARYWTARTRHKPRAFREVSHAAILHLPADKPFLSRLAAKPLAPEDLLARIRRQVIVKSAVRRAMSLAPAMRCTQAKSFPPRY